LVGEEEHNREELTVDGGRLSHDPWWTAKEVANDRDSWGRTTARPRGLATWMESPNGGVKRWLISGEWTVVAYLGDE
jgi:hypothetical protein